MTKILVDRELLPCPFCGSIPELPSGDGTQYEIECNCGMAISSVQICDLMTQDERQSAPFANYRYPEQYVERAKSEAIAAWNRRAQTGDEPEVVAWLWEYRGRNASVDRKYAEDLMQDGEHVAPLIRKSDYDALAAKVAELEAQRDEMTSALQKIKYRAAVWLNDKGFMPDASLEAVIAIVDAALARQAKP